MQVVGVDGYAKGWVAIVLEDGQFHSARLHRAFADLLAAYPDAIAIGVDIPIGLPAGGRRTADEAARQFIGISRAGSVFWTPPLAALQAQSHAEAVARCRELGAPGVSAQAFALRDKILEVDRALRPHVREIHPEVTFCALAVEPLASGKKSWTGLMTRRRLLAERGGIVLPDELPEVDAAHADDVLDAAAAAWSANRIARDKAEALPNPPERDDRGRPVAIYY